MKPAPFDYLAPETLEAAIEALVRFGPDARPLAGGQSLVPMLALRLARPAVLVDLNRIAALAGIRDAGTELRIGAMTRQAEVLNSPLVARRAPLMVQALAQVGHPPTRARGTIGGSLAHADPAAELPVAMLALDAQLVIRSARGERLVAAAEFFRGMFETAIGEGELLTEIRVLAAPGQGSAFLEVSRRRGDFAIASVAAQLATDARGRCLSARLVLGAVAPVPLRCPQAESRLAGRPLDDGAIADAVAALPLDAIALDSTSASRAYRMRIAPVLAQRVLAAAARNAEGRAQ
jgi:carbon-monoxide dehydrogenase medium subunit